METQAYCDWINDWLAHKPDLRIRFIGKSSSHFMFSFDPQSILRECPSNEIIFFDDKDIFLNVDDRESVNREILKYFIEMPDENFQVACAMLTVGLILNSK